MFFSPWRPSTIVEESLPGRFCPPRPRPPTKTLNPVSLVLAARYSLLSIWTEQEYDAQCSAGRLFGRQIVVVNSPEAVKYVMVTAHDNFERKSPQMRRALERLLGDGLFISDGETWKRRRPLVAEIVHSSRLPTFAQTMEQCIAEFSEGWSQLSADEPINLLSAMAELTASIIARSVFGNRLGAAAAKDVVDGFSRYQQWIDSFNLAYFLGLDEGLPILKTPRLSLAIKKVHRVIEKVIEDHLAGKGDAASMVDMLVKHQARNPEAALDILALRNEAATIFMAGHETTATALTWAFYLLANAPWVESKLIEEIKSVCGDRTPSFGDVPQLNWCRAVVEETLRLYPPVPFLARQAKAKDKIADIEVEPASLIIVSPWLLHRSPQLWDRPHEFVPERFFGPSRPGKYVYLPFSVGPRVCVGQAFGMTEAILCVASLAGRFNIRPIPGTKVEPVCRLSLRPRNGLSVTVCPR